MSMDPSQGPGLPPELMALLSQGGAGAGAPAGPPPPQDSLPQDAPPPDAGGDQWPDDPVGIIQMMIEGANKYMQVEPDEEDKATMATNVLSKLQQYLAKDQKDGEDMLQGKMSPRAMRKAGTGGPGGY